jgi:hypothetical protein
MVTTPDKEIIQEAKTLPLELSLLLTEKVQYLIERGLFRGSTLYDVVNDPELL